MIEKTNTTENSVKNDSKTVLLNTRPRPKFLYLWTKNDVQNWYRRHCGEYSKYAELFLNHDITGKALLRITDGTLLRMGISNPRHREAIFREIVKERLKLDTIEIMYLQAQ